MALFFPPKYDSTDTHSEHVGNCE